MLFGFCLSPQPENYKIYIPRRSPAESRKSSGRVNFLARFIRCEVNICIAVMASGLVGIKILEQMRKGNGIFLLKMSSLRDVPVDPESRVLRRSPYPHHLQTG